MFSILPNTYALIFLVGGAIWSAIQYARKQQREARAGQLADRHWRTPAGIGGSFTRFGYVEVLFVTEFIGLILIWAGYRAMASQPVASIHAVQQS